MPIKFGKKSVSRSLHGKRHYGKTAMKVVGMDKIFRKAVAVEELWRCSRCGTLYADSKSLKKKACEECGTKMTPMKEKVVRS